MKLSETGKLSLAFISLLALILVPLVLMVAKTSESAEYLAEALLQFKKSADSGRLVANIMKETSSVEMYLLTGDTFYLTRLREMNHIVKKDINEIASTAEKNERPLARRMLELSEEYTRLCEERVIPAVESGRPLTPDTRNRLAQLEEEMVATAARIQNARADSTSSLAAAVQKDFYRIADLMLFLFFWIIGLLSTAGILVTQKIGREHGIYSAILRSTRNAIVAVDRGGVITTFNQMAEALFEIDAREVIGKHFDNVFTGRVAPGEVNFTYPVVHVATTGQGICKDEKMYQSPDGWEQVLLLDCLPLDEGHRIAGAVLLARDITEAKVIEQRLFELTQLDGLTGLHNHTYLKRSLQRELAEAQKSGRKVAFLLLDIDNFKVYNDWFGHLTGDGLLQEFSRVLRRSVRSTDILGRYGGDEFAVIMPGADSAAAQKVGERIRLAIENYPFLHREEMPGGKITASIGIAVYPEDARNVNEMIAHADEAMYRVKRKLKNEVQLYFSVVREYEKDFGDLEPLLMNTAKALLIIINNKDRYTYAHSEKVAEYAGLLAENLSLPDEEVKKIRLAAFLHDIGKIELPRQILTKPAPLSEDEWALVKQHPSYGANILRSLKMMDDLIPLVLYHHERYDGRGYPIGLAGEKIPLGARILALADSFDAMLSTRPYKKPRSFEETVREIREQSGKQFDPVLVDVFLKVIENTRVHQGQVC